MLAIKLGAKIEKRLDQLATKTGRTKEYHAKLAITEYLDDREDHLVGMAALERNEPQTKSADVRKELGLDR